MKSHPAGKLRGTDAGPVFLCIAFYAVADLLLGGRVWFLDYWSLLVALGVLSSQCSLAAIWAACSGANSYLRFAVPPFVTVVSWYVMTRILPWGIGGPNSALWAIVLAVQTLLIVPAILVYELFWQARTDSSHSDRSRFTFNVRTLMLWTTVVAFGFGFIQFGRIHWGWSASVAQRGILTPAVVLGMFDAGLAVALLWALSIGSWRWRTAKIVIVLFSIGPLTFLLVRLLDWTAGSFGIEFADLLRLAAYQGLFVSTWLAVVLVLRSRQLSVRFSKEV